MMYREFFRRGLLVGALLPGPALQADAPWSVDLPTAQAMARAEGKSVLIHFSGSDWNGWCMKLRKEVFQKAEFDAYAKSNLVLVLIDFPKHKPLPIAQQALNQRVADQFQVQGFPTLILLDSQGKRLGNVNYGQGGPKAFLAEIERLVHPPREPPPAPARPPPTPSFRRARHQNGATENAATEPNSVGLTLKKITGSKQKRQALINNRTLAVGETATIKVGSGHLVVQCLEIREKSVIVSVQGERERREIKLAAGT